MAYRFLPGGALPVVARVGILPASQFKSTYTPLRVGPCGTGYAGPGWEWPKAVSLLSISTRACSNVENGAMRGEILSGNTGTIAP